MGKIISTKSLNEQGLIIGLEISGMLVLENSLQLKKEFADAQNCMANQLSIVVCDIDEIDLSCIQLFIAFIECMDNAHVTYQFDWKLEEDQRILLENAGLSNELYLNN